MKGEKNKIIPTTCNTTVPAGKMPRPLRRRNVKQKLFYEK